MVCIKGFCHPKLITFNDNIPLDSIMQKGMASNDGKIIFTQVIDIDADAFYSTDTVDLQLDNEEIVVSKKYSFSNTGIGYLYNAYESDDAQVVISKLGNNFHGLIHSASGTYNVETYDDLHILEKINMDDVPDDLPPILSEYLLDSLNSSKNIDRSGISRIRVLVMYTPEAIYYRPNMLNKVFTDINNGNSSFLNSSINARFELAYVGPTGSSESGLSFEQLLDKYRTSGDGMFDEVHTLRNKYTADVCVLLVNNSEYCGLGYIGSNSTYAFAVVQASVGCEEKYSFTHEIGHNIGCGHDLQAPTHNSPYNYGHGYVHYVPGEPSNSWRTMMAYSTACGSDGNCMRQPYWSNPDIYYNGIAMGTTTNENNARVWNERASTVMAFQVPPLSASYTASNNNTQALFESLEAPYSITTSAGFEVQAGQTLEMSAVTIRLSPNTHIKNGAKFRAYVPIPADTNPYPQFVKAKEPHLENPSTAFYVSPNPAKDIINIQYDGLIEKIFVFNFNGQCILQTTQTRIDISHLPQGVYIIRASSEVGMMLQTKFIHQ